MRHRCAHMFRETVELPVGKIWKEVRESQTIFAAAGDTQAKPTRVSGGLDLLVYFYFYSGAVRGLLIGRSQKAIYRIVRNCCGFRTTPSDFHYVIPGLTGKPKSASFFAF